MLIVLLMLSACLTAPDKTTDTLRKSGYTDIEVTGYDLFSCGEDDTFSTGFIARNPRGDLVEGTVCCGFLAKSCTIRF